MVNDLDANLVVPSVITKKEYQNLFYKIYWICKEEIALIKSISLNLFNKNCIGTPLPDYYNSSKSISNIVNSISCVIFDQLMKEIQKSKHIGILLDESTDITQNSILLMYIRHFSDEV